MSNLECLQEFFQDGDAQSERTFISNVFVTPNEYKKIISPRMHQLKVIVGKKGSGKSAILEYLKQECEQAKIPCISLVPPDFADSALDECKSPATYIKFIYEKIISAIVRKLGKCAANAVSGAGRRLHKESRMNGADGISVVDILGNSLNLFCKSYYGIDFQHIFGETIESDVVRKKEDISSFLEKKDKICYILLDDIDQIADATNSKYIDIIWYEILAMAQISKDLMDVYPILTVRKEIWRKFSTNTGNRDKYDQIRVAAQELMPDRDSMKKILQKRLNVCIEKNDIHASDSYEPFFENRECQLPSSDEKRLWEDYLTTTSVTPRAMVQLIYKLAEAALDVRHERIGNNEVESVAHAYSKERVRDLVEENKVRYNNVKQLIESFAYEKHFLLPSEKMRQHLKRCEYLRCSQIDGEVIRSTDDIIFPLWKFLYNIEFITARTKDRTQSRDFSFVPYDEYLVAPENWQNMQKYSWEIHPCYRTYLLDYRKAEKNRKGTVNFW